MIQGSHINCLTVDVEDYFQVSAFAGHVCHTEWDTYPCRVEANTNRLLSIFDRANVRGTFFVLGWIADRYPRLLQRIVRAGHEIASHGYRHQLVYDLSPKQFEADVVASRTAIQNACGVDVTIYRAPSFSIVPRSRWALDVLATNQFKVDSSVFPIAGHDRYGDPDAPRSVHRVSTKHGDLIEFPPTAGRIGKTPVPIGGGYFRLLPLKVTQLAIDQVQRQIGPAMFYIHPWEIDPDQPRIAGAKLRSRFRHCVGLAGTESKLKRLLRSHSFTTMSEVIRRSFSESHQPASKTELAPC